MHLTKTCGKMENMLAKEANFLKLSLMTILKLKLQMTIYKKGKNYGKNYIFYNVLFIWCYIGGFASINQIKNKIKKLQSY